MDWGVVPAFRLPFNSWLLVARIFRSTERMSPTRRYLRNVGVGAGFGLVFIIISRTARGEPPLIGLVSLLEWLAFIGASALLGLPSLVLDVRRSRLRRSSER